MAEELDIRSIWNKGKEKEDPSSLSINMMERKGTKTTLYWIKTILWAEFWLTIVLVPLIIYSYRNQFNVGVHVAYSIVCFAYLFYYQFLINAIKKFNYDENIVQSLKKVYGYLRFYLLHYKVVIWVITPVSFAFGFIEGYKEAGGNLPEDAGFKFWAIIIGSIIISGLVLGGILHVIVHLIYGRKIKRLKRTVIELEKED